MPRTVEAGKLWRDTALEEARDVLLSRLGETVGAGVPIDHIVAFALLGIWRELERQRSGPPRPEPSP